MKAMECPFSPFVERRASKHRVENRLRIATFTTRALFVADALHTGRNTPKRVKSQPKLRFEAPALRSARGRNASNTPVVPGDFCLPNEPCSEES